MMKVKMKISGAFRTFEAACDFASVRSVVATARKRGWNILHAQKDFDPRRADRNALDRVSHILLVRRVRSQTASCGIAWLPPQPDRAARHQACRIFRPAGQFRVVSCFATTERQLPRCLLTPDASR